MNPNAKFTTINTLFFGVVGSLIGGIIPTLISSMTVHEPSGYQMIVDEGMFEATRKLLMEYVLLSLAVGFIPASIAGYLYAGMYKNEYIVSGAVNFWRELKFGAIVSIWSMLGCCIFLFIIMVTGAFSQPTATIDVAYTVFWSVFRVWVILTFLGVISGMACSNLIREWNQKLCEKLE